MGSRWVRTVVVILALATLAFAGNQIRLSNATLADEQGRERVFTDLGWTLKLTLAELRSAQQAYVADGQDRDYWIAQVAAHLETVSGSLDNLKQVANPGTLDALDLAVEAVADIREMDEEAREHIGSDQPLAASDLIFTEGFELVDLATAQVQAALQAERTTRLGVMRVARSTQATMMWIVAVVIVLSMLVLAPLHVSSEAYDPTADSDEYRVSEPSGLSLLSLDNDSAVEALDRAGRGDAGEAAGSMTPAAGDAGPDPGRESPAEPAPDLGAVAALCTDFGNLTDRGQLSGLLARTAALMNATGLIIWVTNENARTLLPALGHGYPPGTLERIGSIPQVGDNPTSAAFTTNRIQVVESSDADTGALAAPLMVADRCIGVLSVELRDDWASSHAVQATASILAAQFAPLLPSDPRAVAPVPAAATGTHDKEGAGPGTEAIASSSSSHGAGR